MSPAALRVLVTARTLAHRGGSELYARDLLLGLARVGHTVAAWSPEPGALAAELAAVGVPVAERLEQVPFEPDLVHANQHPEAAAALLFFPRAVGVFTCHARRGPESAPPLLPRLRRYVAVDLATRARLLREGAPAERIARVPNAVDLERFGLRPAPLPPRPRRALLFSNYAREETHLPMVRAACAAAGIELEVAGAGIGKILAQPERTLPTYDLVFAKARCALEALAAGAAVVLCDAEGLGPLCASGELDGLRQRNFGGELLTRSLSVAALRAEIERYDPVDAERVCNWVRAQCGLGDAIASLTDLYRQALSDDSPVEPAEELRAAARYLQRWSPAVRDAADLRDRLERAERYALELQGRIAEMFPSQRAS